MDYHNHLTAIMKEMSKSHEEIIRAVCDDLGHNDKADELVTRLLDTSYKSVKAKKDPNRLKRPKSAYLFFCADKRVKIQADNPGMRMGDIAKALGKLWASVSDEDRVRYTAMHEEEAVHYEQQRQ